MISHHKVWIIILAIVTVMIDRGHIIGHKNAMTLGICEKLRILSGNNKETDMSQPDPIVF
ncbi:hypothetical protein GCM10008927_04720 [Amylibacter ulvae]|uniref:Uncharacterized protein n=1 Tax=Paramylibacter ulvae TaxID=1651968 RepID=A0ABQ3CXF7_9RHOB|nr:hypothetical protein GCM10008927_04720 [Amylibacter ulvae]